MYSYGYLFYIPVTLLFGVAIILNGIIRKRPLGYYLMGCLCCIYVNNLIDKAFFPIWLDGRDLFVSVRQCIDLSLNFNDFNQQQITRNIMLTLPIGILLPFLVSTNKLKNTITTIVISLSIEFIQLAMICTLHTVDIIFDLKDIILNVSGGILGCICFFVISKIVTKVFKKDI